MDGVGSMKYCGLFVIFLLILAGSAGAILPPDAKYREPQLRVYRQQVSDNYEKKQVARQSEAFRAHEKTRADILTPPWMRGGVRAGLESGEAVSRSTQVAKASKRNHRFLVSVVLLISLGIAAGWVWYKTREIDE
jgi:hypothetical protein